MKQPEVRSMVVAGAFYSEDPDILRRDIQKYLEAAQPPVSPAHPIGLISPHAGYQYSGGTAAYGYKLLIGKKYKRVIVFALSHRVFFPGASAFTGSGYETPFGIAPVDHELIAKLQASSPIFTFSPAAEKLEHSLEVQIPFLQMVLGDFLLIPILIRDQDLATCQIVADAIRKTLPAEDYNTTLVVGSTDLYHGSSYSECKSSDSALAETLLKFDEREFERMIRRNEMMACGPASVMATMLLSRALGAKKIALLHQTNSADVIGYKSDYVVGYLSAVLY